MDILACLGRWPFDSIAQRRYFSQCPGSMKVSGEIGVHLWPLRILPEKPGLTPKWMVSAFDGRMHQAFLRRHALGPRRAELVSPTAEA
jgi:hypothetical protein